MLNGGWSFQTAGQDKELNPSPPSDGADGLVPDY